MIRTVIVAVAAASLAACSSAAVPHTVHAAHTSASMPVRDRVYLKVMRDHFAPARLPTSTLLAARRETCQQLADGASWLGMVAILTKDDGFSGGDAGFMVGAAVRTGCPQFLSLMP